MSTISSRSARTRSLQPILALMENQKLVAEGAGATPVAAALFGQAAGGRQKDRLPDLGRQHRRQHPLARHQPRPHHERPQVQPDHCAGGTRPGQLTRVSESISGCGANVVSVQYDLGDTNMAISSCFLKLGLETRDAAQISEIPPKAAGRRLSAGLKNRVQSVKIEFRV